MLRDVRELLQGTQHRQLGCTTDALNINFTRGGLADTSCCSATHDHRNQGRAAAGTELFAVGQSSLQQ